MRGYMLAQTVKDWPAVQETWVQPLGQGDPLEEGMAPHSSVIAWRISWTQEPGGLRSTVHRVAKSWTRLKRLSTHIYTHTFEGYAMCVYV